MTFHSRHIQNPAIPFPNMRSLGDPGPMPRRCQWPMWDDQERATHRYCGEANAIGRVYCPEHAARAYVAGGGAKITPADFGGAPAPQPRVEKVNKPKPVAVKPKRTESRTRPGRGGGPGVFARQLPEVDLRLCCTDQERQIVTLWNAKNSQRVIGRALKISHNTVAGMIKRIRARDVWE